MLKKFPISLQKILPAVIAAGALAGCHSAAAVEASTTRDPVVAPAGTVLRVRLNDALSSERSRPGDRFVATLDTAITAGTEEVLPRGASVEGHVLATREQGRTVLSLTLDSVERDGRRYPLATAVVTRTGARFERRESVALHALTNDGQDLGIDAGSGVVTSTGRHVVMPAESIVGFTLQHSLAL